MQDVVRFLVGLLIFGLYVWSITWAYRDAQSRGKPGWIVALAVFLFWLLALGVWFLVRPRKPAS